MTHQKHVYIEFRNRTAETGLCALVPPCPTCLRHAAASTPPRAIHLSKILDVVSITGH